jgi:tetratricopeptide (TPR) repeat protein
MKEDVDSRELDREALARERLEELQALARTYRNWSVKELAIALGRQPGRLIPDSGMPKIDVIVGLAKALDWPIEAVVDHLMKPSARQGGVLKSGDKPADYASLFNESLQKRFERDYFGAIRCAVRAGAVADNPTRRAAAWSIESDAHEASGSYQEALRCLQFASQIEGVALDWRLLIDTKIANVLFMQGAGTQVIGIASSVLDYAANAEQTHVLDLARSLAHWARAHALRASIPTRGFEAWKSIATNARADFEASRAIALQLQASGAGYDDKNLTYLTAIDVLMMELQAVGSGIADPTIEALIAQLRSCANDKVGVSEQKAWSAVVLANTAKRFMPDDMRLWGVLDLCSGVLKAHAIATSNWFFAHRHLELDQERRSRLGFLRFSTHALGPQEARLVAGVLGHVTSSRLRADEFLELYATRPRRCLEST